MDKATELLILAKEILEDEVEWCKGVLYLEDPNDENKIVSACAIGALDIASGRLFDRFTHSYTRRDTVNQAEMRLIAEIPMDNVPDYNDLSSTSKEDILLMFKRAIG